MSVVGPRPPLESELPLLRAGTAQALGEAGTDMPWQISGRSNITDFDEW